VTSPSPSAAIDRLDSGRASRFLVAGVRISLGVLWIQNVSWKHPPLFGRPTHTDLFEYTDDAITHPVLAPFAWLVQHLVLPNFTAFGYATLALEFALGALLTAGLLTRVVGAVALLQTLAITLSALYAPGEWQWSYYLMIAAHLLVVGLAAGRVAGADALLRPGWARRPSRLHRILLALS
jgi:thiosulfate dehydrogenase [quinone] large subunit